MTFLEVLKLLAQILWMIFWPYMLLVLLGYALGRIHKAEKCGKEPK